MPGAFNISLARLSPRLRQTDANVETMNSTVAERWEADLIVFPEYFLSGFTTVGPDELAVDLEGSDRAY